MIEIDGFLCREGTADKIAVAETRRLFKRPGAPRPGDVCLDLGAHIGSFTRRALEVGVDSVIAVEPEPENCALWEENLAWQEERSALIEAAVSNHSNGTTLSLSSTYGHTTVDTGRNRETIEVHTIPFTTLVDDFAPTYIKVDIEGAEYELGFPDSIPITCDRVFIEFHLTFGNRSRGIALRQAFLDQGWTPLWELGADDKANMEGAFVR